MATLFYAGPATTKSESQMSATLSAGASPSWDPDLNEVHSKSFSGKPDRHPNTGPIANLEHCESRAYNITMRQCVCVCVCVVLSQEFPVRSLKIALWNPCPAFVETCSKVSTKSGMHFRCKIASRSSKEASSENRTQSAIQLHTWVSCCSTTVSDDV